MSDAASTPDGGSSPEHVPEFVPSMSAAARVLKVTSRTLRNWRAERCPGFEPDGRVDVAHVRAWAEKRLDDKRGTVDVREEKILEEIRRLRIANDAKEGRLVERVWVAARMQQAAGELNTLRAKWEAEMPMKFAETNGEITECRTILRGIFDAIFASVQSLAKHFEEDTR